MKYVPNDSIVNDTWLYDDRHFLETGDGVNILWSDPFYGGSNQLQVINQTFEEYITDHPCVLARPHGKTTLAALGGSWHARSKKTTNRSTKK